VVYVPARKQIKRKLCWGDIHGNFSEEMDPLSKFERLLGNFVNYSRDGLLRTREYQQLYI
jgi:hypothetical protein